MPDLERVKTTFWMDFTIADAFGVNAVKDTYNRAFNDWKSDYRYITELAIVVNHKCWSWNERNNEYMEVYRDLYYKVRDWALNNLKGDELIFYLQVTD